MITLYTFGPAYGLPDASPFVTKATLLLKLAGLPYKTDTTGFRKAPKSKLPYINDDGVVVADSTFIRFHIEKKYQIDFDQGLSAQQRGTAWAVEKLLEDNLYWALLQSRWCDDANFAKGPAFFFKAIPWPARPLIVKMIRRKIAANLKVHGIGRHTPDEVATLTARTVESMAALLGDKPYLMGEQPCGADATFFAFTAGLLCPDFEMPARKVAEAQANLVAYSQRMMREYFPELARAPA